MLLKQLIKYIKSDLKANGATKIRSCISAYFTSAKFRLLLNYRLGKFFTESRFKPFKALALRYKYRQITKRNCQISYNCSLGYSVTFPHPIGIVIGDDVVIGNNVKIWQQVTIGSHGKSERTTSYPVIADNVKIFAGAKVFGNITIGGNAVIAANAVVNKSVENNDVVAGIPAVSIKKITEKNEFIR